MNSHLPGKRSREISELEKFHLTYTRNSDCILRNLNKERSAHRGYQRQAASRAYQGSKFYDKAT